jgi:hypothetical protein
MKNPRVVAPCAVAAPRATAVFATALFATALIGIAALAACHRDSSPAAPPKPDVQKHAPVATQRGPTADELTADMVEAATLGKSQVPVALKFDLLRRPTVGQPLEIAIALIPQIPANPATIDVSGSDGLQIAPGEGRIEIPAVEPAQVYRHSVKITPTAEGVLLLSLTVGLKHDEMTETRMFAVPIIVEASSAPAAGPSSAAAGQSRVAPRVAVAPGESTGAAAGPANPKP